MANAGPARRFVGAIDQGTTSTRFILFDHDGRIAATAQKEHRQIFPHSGWVEHDPEEIWSRTEDVVREALASVGASPSDVVSLGITNQRETLVVWDRETGKAYYNAIVWQDQRGAHLCEELSAAPGGKDRFRSLTGLPLVPYFTASKLAWVLENVEGVRAAAESGRAIAGTIDSFLVWRLTNGGLHITDVSNASRTLLLNIHTMKWDPELCAAFKVPPQMLPAVRPSSVVYGSCAGDSVLPGVPIAGILGDQQAALFGQACFEPGDAKNTYGTGCFLLMNTGDVAAASQSGLLTTVAYQIGDGKPIYALEGSVAVAGAVISWLRDNLGLISNAREVEDLAAQVTDTAGMVFVPAFNGLFAPHWRSDARGVMVGLSGIVTRAHVARAALEAVAQQSRELLQAMDRDAAVALKGHGASAAAGHALRVDGGMTANSLLMQFQADIIGRKVVRPLVAETTALGAAYAAGLAVGFWKDLAELKEHWEIAATWQPNMLQEKVVEAVSKWDRAVARTLNWMPAVPGATPAAIAAAAAADPALGLLRPSAAAGAASAAAAATTASRGLFGSPRSLALVCGAFAAGVAVALAGTAVTKARRL